MGCYTKAQLGPIDWEAILDSGAGLNTIPEEAVLNVINSCEAAGMNLGDEGHPVVELQTWEKAEECRGVAGGVTVPLIGAVVIMLTFIDKNTSEKQTTPAKF